MKQQPSENMRRLGGNVVRDNEIELSLNQSLYQDIGAGRQHDDLRQVGQKIFEDRHARFK